MKHLYSYLLLLTSVCLFTGCQRNQALFQRSTPPDHWQSEGVITQSTVADEQAEKANEAVVHDKADLLVSATSDLPKTTLIGQRMAQIDRQLVASQDQVEPGTQVQRSSLRQQVLTKYLAKKIHKQLAPNMPQDFSDYRQVFWIVTLVLLIIGAGAKSDAILILGLIVGFLAIIAEIVHIVRLVKYSFPAK